MNRKRISLLFVSGALFVTILLLYSIPQITKSSFFEPSTTISLVSNSNSSYKDDVAKFKRIDSKDIYPEKKINGNIIIYFGRESCPYCREFVPVLRESSSKKNIDIYYFDTEHTDQDLDKQQVRSKYGIDQVPTLISVKSNGDISEYSFDKNDLREWLIAENGS